MLLCVKIRNEVCANIVPIFGELIKSAILFDESYERILKNKVITFIME